MTTKVINRGELPRLTFDERDADYMTGTSRHTRWRARKRGELRSVETTGNKVLYTQDMLLDWLNLRRERKGHKRKR